MAGTLKHRVVTVRSIAQRCPICNGCGSVEHNFYTQMTSGTSANRQACQACNGGGIVYGTETTTSA